MSLMRQIHYIGQWKGLALKIKTFLDAEMATSKAFLDTEMAMGPPFQHQNH
jgi:hypothetical protein